MHHRTNQVTSRLMSVALFSITALISIVVYLFYLQVHRQGAFNSLSERNFLRIEKVQAPRANILDCNGVLLATNRPVDSIYWVGTGNKILNDEQKETIADLAQIIPITEMLESSILQAEQKCSECPLALEITFEQLSQLTEQCSSTNVLLKRSFKRYYPLKQYACHIVGYLGLDQEIKGKMGLERVCDDSLKGTAGQVVKTINSVGRQLTTVEVSKGLTGDAIQTTLNSSMQSSLERFFPEGFSGVAILMDPHTGAIEALVSRPSFDPNMFLSPISQEQWKELQEQKCFLNRAVSACYPPASPFKLISISAALETHLINESNSWVCCGKSFFAHRAYQCSNVRGHGRVDTLEAVAHSCNIPFFDIARKIKIDVLADYAHKFGLGEKTNVLFDDKQGLIPTSNWKMTVKGEPWWPGETLSAIIGQSYLLVTPMQVARMISAICAGHLVTPRVLEDEPIEHQPLHIKKSTLEFLRKSMYAVVNMGTGQRLKRLLGPFDIHAKTGTAQVQSLSKEKSQKSHQHHAWFAGYFSYKNHAPKTLVILVEHAGVTTPALKMALSFLREYGRIIEAEKEIEKKSAKPAQSADSATI